MNRNLICPILVSLSVLLLIGCSSTRTESGQERLGYIPARCYDFLDILELNLGLASEYSLYAVVAVEPFAVGTGIYECEKFGLDGRLFGQWTESRAEIDLGPESVIRYTKKPNWGNRYLFNAFYSPFQNELGKKNTLYKRWGMSHRLWDHERRFGDISVESHGILGVDAGISLVETWDFIFGILGFDVISDDDWVDPISHHHIPLYEEETEGSSIIGPPVSGE